MSARAKNFKTHNLPSLSISKNENKKSSQREISDHSLDNYFSTFPSEEDLDRAFGNAYVLNQPVNGVGGDGFWQGTKGDCSFLIVFDCMGHGRFAAMMTRFYIRIIHEIVVNRNISKPDEILNGIHQQVKEEFKNQDAKHVGTGADIGVLVFDRKQHKMTFSGAGMDLVVSSERNFERIKGERKQVGQYFEVERSYQSHVIEITKRNIWQRYYLFSDGVTDLFGGPKGKKLGFNKLSEILKDGLKYELSEEKKYVENALSHWAGSNEPLDDLLIIGLSLR
ncbi:PP2C family protein-serine/threonine phosphatase [Marinoscillum sp. MHG1-6]|uniref:PP2C family protein-serine/threonine phosphatase n=1 Tax=Marinoscillum sp. MHG1-6 TaxID=2959627 RepID=UPI0021570EA0|nr:SpoIIE family protein phosphatase [Marinoscillum sp. MHG1-6]